MYILLFISCVITFLFGYKTSTYVENIKLMKKYKKKYIEPIVEMISKPASDFSFIKRVNNFVTIQYNEMAIIMDISETDRAAYIYDGGKLIITPIKDINDKYMEDLYMKLEQSFYYDIYVNIITFKDLSGAVNFVSKSFVQEVTNNDYIKNVDIQDNNLPPKDLDYVLNKINESGMNSLTSDELELLKGYSDE